MWLTVLKCNIGSTELFIDQASRMRGIEGSIVLSYSQLWSWYFIGHKLTCSYLVKCYRSREMLPFTGLLATLSTFQSIGQNYARTRVFSSRLMQIYGQPLANKFASHTRLTTRWISLLDLHVTQPLTWIKKRSLILSDVINWCLIYMCENLE